MMRSTVLQEHSDGVITDDDQRGENIGPVTEAPSTSGSDMDDETEHVVLPRENTDQVKLKLVQVLLF